MVKTNSNYPSITYKTNNNTSNNVSHVNRNTSNNNTYGGNYNYNYNNNNLNRQTHTEVINFSNQVSNVNAALEKIKKEREKLVEKFRLDLENAEKASKVVSAKYLSNYSTNNNGAVTIHEVNRMVKSNSNDINSFDIKVTDVNGSIILKGSKYVRVFSDGSYKFYVDGQLRDFPVLNDKRIEKIVDINKIKEIKKNGASTDIYMEDGSVTHIIEGNNTFICGEDKDGNFNYAYHIEDDGSLTNIDIFGKYTEANDQFGGNQMELYYNTAALLNDPKMMEELERAFPGTTWNEKACYLQTLSDSACGYTGSVNGIFRKYIGREKEFKEKFGYDMYKIDCNGNLDFNYENMIVDFYSYCLKKQGNDNIYSAGAASDGYGAECTQEFSNYLFENYQISSYAENYISEEDRANGNAITGIQDKNEILDVYHSYVDQGKDNIMIGSWGYHLIDYNTGVTSFCSSEGKGHAMVVLGEENGNLIVSSWGEKYILDLDYMGNYDEAYSYFYTTDYE